MFSRKVLLLALNYFGLMTASLGMLIFIPQIIKSLGPFSNTMVGWLTMIPYICGGIAMVTWPISDQLSERRWNSSLRVFHGWARTRRLNDGHVVGVGGYVDSGSRVLRLQGTIFCYAADVAEQHCAGGLPCLD